MTGMVRATKKIRKAALALGLLLVVNGASAQRGSGSNPYLHVEGKVMDRKDKALSNATVSLDTNGTFLTRMDADTKGRFAMDLEIGPFYGITIEREGFIKKRFLVDTRTDDPSSIITGPFHADITLTGTDVFTQEDAAELDFPFAMVTYSRKDKAFLADPAYIEEMRKVEAALMLSSAFSRKKESR